MPTTDIRLARTVLEQCSSAGFEFALLQPLPDVPDGNAISDLDIVWEAPIDRATIQDLVDRALGPLGLQLVIASPYDIGAVSLFALSEAGHDGVHLDLVHDDAGVGRLGVRYARLLERSKSTPTAPVIDYLDRLLYLARKRQWKGQHEELAGVVAALRGTQEQAELRAADLLTGRARHDIRQLLVGEQAPGRFGRRPALSMQAIDRVRRRLRYPVGAWVHLDGASEAIARELSERFLRTVVHSCAVRLDSSPTSMMRELAGKIAPVRWRAGVAFSHGTRPSNVSPDVLVSASGRTVDDVAREAVDQLGARPALLTSVA